MLKIRYSETKSTSIFILIVEDQPAISDLLAECLNEEGYNTIQAPNALEALRMVRAIQFDLITLDLSLPAMDGNQFLDKILALNILPPVVMITATPQEINPSPLIKGVLSKPFNIVDLVATVTELVGPAVSELPPGLCQ